MHYRTLLLSISVAGLMFSSGCVLEPIDLPSDSSPTPDETPTAQTPEDSPTPPAEVSPTPFPSLTPPSPSSGIFDANATIETVAGSGDPGTAPGDSIVVEDEGMMMSLGSNTGAYSGDGGAATSARLSWPTGVAVNDDGEIYIADQYNCAVRKVDVEGRITTSALAFTVPTGSGDSWHYLFGPGGIELTEDNDQYIVDSWSCTVLKVDDAGIPRVVAGIPESCHYASSSGDGGSALEASLDFPTGMAVDSKGNLFIADFYSGLIRKVDTDGIISTVAGQGYSRVSTTPMPATEAKLGMAGGIAIGPQDELYITDNFFHQIDKITPDGQIVRVAGVGVSGFSGDGGPALEAQLSFPTGVRVHSSGAIFFTDTFNQRVRAIGTDGNMYTVAGNGVELEGEYSIGTLGGDGGRAVDASLSQPYALDFDGEGNLYIADAMNNRIRKVTF